MNTRRAFLQWIGPAIVYVASKSWSRPRPRPAPPQKKPSESRRLLLLAQAVDDSRYVAKASRPVR